MIILILVLLLLYSSSFNGPNHYDCGRPIAKPIFIKYNPVGQTLFVVLCSELINLYFIFLINFFYV